MEFPQSSVWGQYLFLNFINDLPSVIQAIKKLFADDAKIYQIVTNSNKQGRSHTVTKCSKQLDILDSTMENAFQLQKVLSHAFRKS